jgi:hypothetical protein
MQERKATIPLPTGRLGNIQPRRREQRSNQMAVIMRSERSGQTAQGHEGLLDTVGPTPTAEQGLALHASHPVGAGWRVIEIRETREDATRFFATNIAPSLPEHSRPKQRFPALHGVLQP